MERLQKTRLLSIAVLGVIFGSGLLLGLALDSRLDQTDDPPAVSEEQSSAESNEGKNVPLYHQVGTLTAQQNASIDSIMELQRESIRELKQDFDDFRDKYNSRMSRIAHGTREAIKGVLTEEQAIRYDSLLAEYRNARRQSEDSEEQKR
jgi:hypothetical protein